MCVVQTMKAREEVDDVQIDFDARPLVAMTRRASESERGAVGNRNIRQTHSLPLSSLLCLVLSGQPSTLLPSHLCILSSWILSLSSVASNLLPRRAMDSSNSSAPLADFRLRHFHARVTPEGQAPLTPHVQDAIVRGVSREDYDRVLKEAPRAALSYLDDDDGDHITVRLSDCPNMQLLRLTIYFQGWLLV